jgi:glycolate oxidase FAD binding subunit
MFDSISIDGVGPMPVERPATVADLCAVVRRCAETKTAIYPVGGGTMLDYGMLPARPGIALSTAALDQVIDYPARDLTITVGAGITMQKLLETLAAENQWLPIDVPEPERATIGGAIACDVSGPRRLGYGTLRDYVIGITIVNDRGEECKAGGRVVKNVAGYDMMKLHTGALGTLGVITQVTLKVKPRPEVCDFDHFVCRPAALGAAVEALTTSKTVPTAELFLERARWHIQVSFDGSETAVKWRKEQFRLEICHTNPRIVSNRHPFEAPYNPGEEVGVAVQMQVPSAKLAEFCNHLMEIDTPMTAYALAGVGTIDVSLCCPEKWDLARVRQLVDDLSQRGSRVVVTRCPVEWKKSLPIWGRPPADLTLQKAVKRALDPQNIFNPGRFVTDAF